MRILHLTNKPIFPIVDGGCVAMNQLSKLLHNQGFTVKNLSIETSKHPFDLSNFPDSFIENNQPEAVKFETELRASKAVISLIKGSSYNLERFKNQSFSNKLKQLLTTEHYDVVLCESLYLLPFIETIRHHSKAKVIVRTHNVEHKIWERLTKQVRFPKSIYLSILSKRLKKEEISLLNKTDAIISISEIDTTLFKQLSITTPITTLPIFVEKTDHLIDCKSTHFHHIGSMNWKPNLEAVESLLTTIFPAIRKTMPSAELHLAGSFFPDHIKSDASKGIVVHGFVENAFEFIQAHGIQLIPLKSGSGVRIKIIESMAMGTPIVTTPMGVEGIDLSNENAVMVAKNEQEFVDFALELAKNDELRAKVGATAHQFIVDKYSFDKINKEFSEFFRRLS